jgi:hypothetical protein
MKKHRRRMIVAACGLAVIAIVVATLSPVRSAREDVGVRLAELAAQPNATVFRMIDITDFSWDRMCVVWPFSRAEDVGKALGADWKEGGTIGIDARDDINVLVFAWGDSVVETVVHPRRFGDFAVPGHGDDLVALTPDTAVFEVVAGEGGWRFFRPRP